MNEEKYNSLVIKTFRENAIRSVMMIDDDYLTYESMVRSHAEGQIDDLFSKELKATTTLKAAKLQKFFSDKNLICDISDGGHNFEPETARKSDLLILDYELQANDPKESLNILDKLSKTKHMNLVVIYTNRELGKAWLETAASILSGFTEKAEAAIESDPEFNEFWNEQTEHGSALPESWVNLTENDIANFLLEGTCKAFRKSVAKSLDKADQKHTKNVFEAAINQMVGNYDKLHLNNPFADLRGDFGANKWLLIGNVFIAFHKKEDDEDPAEVWNTLEKSLLSWSPNYFRLIASEIQNHVENDGLVFSRYLKENYVTQASWLFYLLKNGSSKDVVDKFLRNEVDSNIESLILNQDILDFTTETLSTFDDFPECCIESKKRYALTKTNKRDDFQKETVESIAKALNHSLAIKNNIPDHITNGLILCHEDSKRWFMCVSPGCDTVPNQFTNKAAQDLSPFRMLKFIELKLNKASDSLKVAHHGRNVFLISNDMALEVGNKVQLQYGICHDHDRIEEKQSLHCVSFFIQNDGQISSLDLKLKSVAQLKDSYAARFQAIASSHVGRVGVDYVTFDLESDL